MGVGGDDPDPSDAEDRKVVPISQPNISTVSIPDYQTSRQDFSASSNYLGNTVMVEDILMGTEGNGFMANKVVYMESGPALLPYFYMHSKISKLFNTTSGINEIKHCAGESDPWRWFSVGTEVYEEHTDWLTSSVTQQFMSFSTHREVSPLLHKLLGIIEIKHWAGEAGSYVELGESQDVAGYLQGESVGPFGGKLDGEGTRHKGAAGRGVCGLRQESTRPLGTGHEGEAFHLDILM